MGTLDLVLLGSVDWILWPSCVTLDVMAAPGWVGGLGLTWVGACWVIWVGGHIWVGLYMILRIKDSGIGTR